MFWSIFQPLMWGTIACWAFIYFTLFVYCIVNMLTGSETITFGVRGHLSIALKTWLVFIILALVIRLILT